MAGDYVVTIHAAALQSMDSTLGLSAVVLPHGWPISRSANSFLLWRPSFLDFLEEEGCLMPQSLIHTDPHRFVGTGTPKAHVRVFVNVDTSFADRGENSAFEKTFRMHSPTRIIF
jgi:hypothetical protein